MEHKPIYLDGVDVSECVSFDKLNGQNICCYEDTRENKIPFANFCVENKDCYFKQLARKTEECEQKDKELLSNEKGCMSYAACGNYTPVEIDPYWKDIIDETNRRLNSTK